MFIGRMAGTVGAIAALALLTAPAAASANGTLDQQQERTDDAVGGDGDVAQTFTAGLTGKLSEVELFLGKPLGLGKSGLGSLEIQIRNVEATGEPGAEVLAEQPLAATGHAEWRSIVFSAPAQVLSGTKYAILVFEPTHTNGFQWSGGDGNPYPQGAAWSNHPSDVFLPPSGPWEELFASDGLDFAFKTYVEPALPTSKQQCKDEGWQSFGATFKNEGQCVSFVATGGKHA